MLKRKKKLDEEKIEKKEIWGKLNELNKEFQTINNTKKKRKKCLRQYQNNLYDNILLLYVINIIYSLLF